jgi:predicted Zn-dependent protease
MNEAVLTLVDMRNSAVLEREPTFNWTRVTGATRYVINVYDRNEKIIWSANTTETRLAYPENRSPLAPGDYKWDVTAQIDKQIDHKLPDRALYDATTFTVVGKGRAEEIETDLARARATFAVDDGTANLVYISSLIEHKRFAEAEDELKASLEREPRDQTLWELLMETYWQMKLWSAREDARRLSEAPNVIVEMIRALKARR